MGIRRNVSPEVPFDRGGQSRFFPVDPPQRYLHRGEGCCFFYLRPFARNAPFPATVSGGKKNQKPGYSLCSYSARTARKYLGAGGGAGRKVLPHNEPQPLAMGTIANGDTFNPTGPVTFKPTSAVSSPLPANVARIPPAPDSPIAPTTGASASARASVCQPSPMAESLRPRPIVAKSTPKRPTAAPLHDDEPPAVAVDASPSFGSESERPTRPKTD